MSARHRLAICCGLIFAALVILITILPAFPTATVPLEKVPVHLSDRDLGAPIAPVPRVVLEKPAGSVRAFGDPRFRAMSGRYGHECFAFSPDGTRIAANTDDTTGEVTVWEYPSGRTVCRFAYGGSGTFDALRFTANGAIIVGVGHSEGEQQANHSVEVRCHDATTGKLLSRGVLAELDATKSIWTAISPDGATILARNEYGPLRLFGSDGGVKWRLPLMETERELTVTVSGDGTRFAATILVGGDVELRTYEAATGRETARVLLPGHDFAPVFSGDGKTIALVNRPGTAIALWDAHSLLQNAEIALDRPANPLAFSPDGRWLVTQVREGSVDVYNTLTGKLAYQLHSVGHVVAFTPDSRTIAFPSGGLVFYDAATGKLLPHSANPPGLGCYDVVHFSPDGRTITAHTSNRTKIARWEIATARELEQQNEWNADRLRREWHTLYSPGERFRLDQIPGQPIAVVDRLTGRAARSFVWPAGQPPVYPWELSGDGRIIFAGDPNSVSRYDANTGRHLGPLIDFHAEADVKSFPGSISRPNPTVCSSPCGRYVLVYPRSWATGRLPVRAFDNATGRQLARWDASYSPGIVGWSGDGGRVAVGLFYDSGTASPYISNRVLDTNEERHAMSGVAVRELPSGKVLRQAQLADRVGIVCASPDLRTLVANALPENRDRTIYLYETASGRVRYTIDPGERWTGKGVFSPDGRFLATLHPKSPVVLWDVRGERPTEPPDAAKWAQAWDALGGDDARKAFAAIRLFATFPERGSEVLKAKVNPLAPIIPPAARVDELIAQLGSDDFRLREAATAELKALGRAADPALRAAVKSTTVPEVRHRLTALLAGVAKCSNDDLRLIRVVEAAEWMETPAARRLLETWAAGPPEATLAGEATSAIARLKR